MVAYLKSVFCSKTIYCSKIALVGLMLLNSEYALALRGFDCDPEVQNCTGGGTGFGGFLNNLPGVVFLVWAIWAWGTSVIAQRNPFWPFGIVFGGIGIVIAYNAKGVGSELFGCLLIAAVVGVWLLRNSKQPFGSTIDPPTTQSSVSVASRSLSEDCVKRESVKGTNAATQSERIDVSAPEALPFPGDETQWIKLNELLKLNYRLVRNRDFVLAFAPAGKATVLKSMSDLDRLLAKAKTIVNQPTETVAEQDNQNARSAQTATKIPGLPGSMRGRLREFLAEESGAQEAQAQLNDLFGRKQSEVANPAPPEQLSGEIPKPKVSVTPSTESERQRWMRSIAKAPQELQDVAQQVAPRAFKAAKLDQLVRDLRAQELTSKSVAQSSETELSPMKQHSAVFDKIQAGQKRREAENPPPAPISLLPALVGKYRAGIGRSWQHQKYKGLRPEQFISPEDEKAFGHELIDTMVLVASQTLTDYKVGKITTSSLSIAGARLEELYGQGLVNLMRRLSWSAIEKNERLFADRKDKEVFGEQLFDFLYRVALRAAITNGAPYVFHRLTEASAPLDVEMVQEDYTRSGNSAGARKQDLASIINSGKCPCCHKNMDVIPGVCQHCGVSITFDDAASCYLGDPIGHIESDAAGHIWLVEDGTYRKNPFVKDL